MHTESDILAWALAAVTILLSIYLRHLDVSIKDLEEEIRQISTAQASQDAKISDIHRQFDRIETTLNLIWTELRSKADRCP